MRRICFIGNSHVAAIKLAWDDFAKEFPEVDIRFFAATRHATDGLLVNSGRLVPETSRLADQIALTSNGHREISPEDYDIFVSYGGLSLNTGSTNSDCYSSELRRQVILGRANDSLTTTHVKRLRQITEKPIVVAPAPLHVRANKVTSPALLPLPEAMHLLNQSILSELRVDFADQPAETLLDQTATKSEFSVGSTRLDSLQRFKEEHADGEVRHMNAAYGTLWLRTHLPCLL